MNIDLLVKMANEIADFFEGESGPQKGPRDVASHLRRFWEPRMRTQIIAHYQRGAAGLNDMAREAVGLLAAEAAQSGAAQGGAAPKGGVGGPTAKDGPGGATPGGAAAKP